MGCDIHFFVERFTSDDDYEGPRDISEERNSKLGELLENRDSPESPERWVSADKWELEDDWDKDDGSKMLQIPYKSHLYRGRNYGLFSILADVRNYDDEIKAICEPKGIPDDASTGYKYQIDWCGDGHSHSYFTLDELLNVDWDSYEKEYTSGFMKTIESMKLMDSDPSKVRCVFFFDN